VSILDAKPLAEGDWLTPRYQLRTRIGAGSMAEVWAADDHELMRVVAVKVVAELLAPSERARQRFAREVWAIGRIEHPNVVALFDHGTLEDGRPYLVMEYHRGESLHTLLEREPRLALRKALLITGQLLDGLAAAHACGVIHRDLKPANILLAHAERGRIIKIVDFGVARILDIAAEEGSERLTATGTMLGSPKYMPFEVARGAPDVDARADIFEAGAVLYHMLCGQPPFLGTAIGRVMRNIIDHNIEPVLSLRPDTPPRLVQMLDRALAHLPDDRYKSARLMRRDLDACLVEMG
jgi:serine/threonine protein kinase